MKGTYESCSQVSTPSTGQLVLDLMCGPWSSLSCTQKRWFHYMGDKKINPYVPFQITYVPYMENMNSSNFTPLNPTVVPCFKAISVSSGLK